MRVIDCHVHLSQWGLPALLRQAELFGIGHLCLFSLGNEVDPGHPMSPPGCHWPAIGSAHQDDSWNPPPERISASNALIESMVLNDPDRLSALCFVNPRHSEHALAEIRQRVGNGPMSGIKLWISCRANDPFVEPIAALAVELGVPILQHCWNKYGGNLSEESSTRDVAELATKFPDLKIIAPHISGHHEDGLLDFVAHPNVFVDTSGMLPDAGILEFAIEVLGPERILFGSDAPLRHPGSALARIQGATISQANRKAILEGNFLSLFDK